MADIITCEGGNYLGFLVVESKEIPKTIGILSEVHSYLKGVSGVSKNIVKFYQKLFLHLLH